MMSLYTDRAFCSLYIDRIKSRYAYYLKVLRLEFLHIPARFVSRVKNLEAKDMTGQNVSAKMFAFCVDQEMRVLSRSS